MFDKTGKIFTKTYEKPNNLHLYVPANSAHPTGTMKSLITGMIRRYWLQNTNKNDFIKQIKMFTKRLLKRGYNSDEITKNIILASENLQLKMGNKRIFIKQHTNTKKSSTNNKIFYHRVYHPKDITNATISEYFTNALKIYQISKPNYLQ